MSEWGDLFTSFYNQFVLRDLLSMVLPGFTVIFVYWILFIEPSKSNYRFFMCSEISLLPLILILAISYFIGILFIAISDGTGCFRTYYTKEPVCYQKRVKDITEKLSSYPYLNCGNKLLQIRERYVIFTQSCGNFGWACIFSMISIWLSNLNEKIPAIVFFLILSGISWVGYDQFKKRQIGWDKQFLGDDYEKWSGLWIVVLLDSIIHKLL